MPDHTIAPTRPPYFLHLRAFLAAKEIVGRAPDSLSNYRTAVERLFACPGMPQDPKALRADNLLEWLAWLRAGGLQLSTVAWHQRHVYAWLGWLLTTKRITRDPRVGVEKVQPPDKILGAVDIDTLIRCITAATRPRLTKSGFPVRETGYERRNVAVLHVLFYCGLRAIELAGLDLGDVDLEERVIRVRWQVAKGDKERIVPFEANTELALVAYLEDRGEEPGPLFVSARGGRFTRTALRMVLRHLERSSGVHVTPHEFRRGFAANVRRNGLDLGNTAELLGHSTLEMARRYGRTGERSAAIRAYRDAIG